MVTLASAFGGGAGSVAVVNVFVGWTFIGWVVAMSMAARSAPVGSTVNVTVGQHNAPDRSATLPGSPGT